MTERFVILSLLIVTLLFGTTQSGDHWFDCWSGKWIVLLGSVSLLVSYNLAKRTHWTVGAFFFVIMVGALKSFGWTLIDRDAAYTAYSAMALVALFQVLKDEHSETLRMLFTVSGVASAVYTVAQFNFDSYSRIAFSGNASMNGCLIAVTAPIAFSFFTRMKDQAMGNALLFCSSIICGIAVFMTNTSIPLGVLAVAATAYVASSSRDRWKTGLAAVMSCSGLLWIALLSGHKSFLNTSGRTYFWKKILEWWWSSKTYWMGLGSGSGRRIFDFSFEMDNVKAGARLSDSMYWAHNDFVQVLFENGIIGLTLALLMTVFAFKASFNRPWLFSAVAAYTATAFFNYPAHLPVHAFLGASLLWMAHRGTDEAPVRS